MHQWRILLKWGFDTHKKLIINKLKSQKVKRDRDCTFSGLPMMVETALVASEKIGSVSTPSRLTLVEM
jgi:hypothetical protein